MKHAPRKASASPATSSPQRKIQWVPFHYHRGLRGQQNDAKFPVSATHYPFGAFVHATHPAVHGRYDGRRGAVTSNPPAILPLATIVSRSHFTAPSRNHGLGRQTTSTKATIRATANDK
ncbi:hypothetical protein Barb4_04186 [Bacteroidales bacterium Barb4]|nr:hypothetical protein Barb4_04186 [Bacteroidales bacterium Barb4]